MSRRYGEPVDVRRRDDVPAEFLWRGRLHVVRDVHAHWVETGVWWQAPAARAVYGTEPDGQAATSTTTLDDGDREVWRVEASSGRLQTSGVYDLRLDWASGAWTLARTQD